jgi:PIN domain nuclease of toxin-antitoxin system
MGLLLDSYAAIWLSQDEPVAAAAAEAIDAAGLAATPVFVSPITAWQIGELAATGRITMAMPPAEWFAALLRVPGMKLAALSPEILIAASFLPGTPPADSAARILAATARAHRLRLITRDQALLAYAAQGHIHAIGC